MSKGRYFAGADLESSLCYCGPRNIYRREPRIASENPPRTAYTAVDAYLGGIDPVAALKKRLSEGGGK